MLWRDGGDVVGDDLSGRRLLEAQMADATPIDRYVDQHLEQNLGRALALCRTAEHRDPAPRDGGLRCTGRGDAAEARLAFDSPLDNSRLKVYCPGHG